MWEKWIGEEDNPSGSYVPTICDELQLRRGGTINAKRLYRFNSRFDVEYNITDNEVIKNIEELLEKGEDGLTGLYDYLYSLIIEKFGVIEFITRIGHKIAQERDAGYREGKVRMQRDMRELLGLK
jgi:hypothetical protein